MTTPGVDGAHFWWMVDAPHPKSKTHVSGLIADAAAIGSETRRLVAESRELRARLRALSDELQDVFRLEVRMSREAGRKATALDHLARTKPKRGAGGL